MKIVVNRCFGGFSISLDAARYMAKRGNKQAVEELKEYEDGKNKKRELKDLEKKLGVRWFGYGYCKGFDGSYERDNIDLVAAVEKLGLKASGECSNLKVVEIPDGIEWEIDEYDGNETIREKHRCC